jgi:hypothetical protein
MSLDGRYEFISTYLQHTRPLTFRVLKKIALVVAIANLSGIPLTRNFHCTQEDLESIFLKLGHKQAS